MQNTAYSNQLGVFIDDDEGTDKFGFETIEDGMEYIQSMYLPEDTLCLFYSFINTIDSKRDLVPLFGITKEEADSFADDAMS